MLRYESLLGRRGGFAIDYLDTIGKWIDGTAPVALMGAHVPAWEDLNVAVHEGLIAPH